jgi:hypothetical protein
MIIVTSVIIGQCNTNDHGRRRMETKRLTQRGALEFRAWTHELSDNHPSKLIKWTSGPALQFAPIL